MIKTQHLSILNNHFIFFYHYVRYKSIIGILLQEEEQLHLIEFTELNTVQNNTISHNQMDLGE